jgi:UDP-N-acetylmuramoyl-L-alanyl-D-glutamate--2,6-diaminopimelate ligase
MMRLSALLAALPPQWSPSRWLRAEPTDDPIIRGVSYDSRYVSPGDLFVALRGTVSDGHEYLDQAAALGAAALLVEDAPDDAPGRLPMVVVPDTRRALAPIASRFYGDPASECTMIGITGTNGKTSTSYLVEAMLRKADYRTGLIGTIGVRYAGQEERAVNTTPESLDLQRTLRAMRTQGVEAVVMEVSSHGLALGRVHGCRFKAAAFINLTQDHLDFHGTMDAYLESKALLFRDHLSPGAWAVVNADDPASEKLVETAVYAGASVLRTSRRADADAEIRVLDADVSLAGSRVRLALGGSEIEVDCPLLGDFNLENLVVACGIAVGLGLDPEAIRAGAAACPQVPGRVELVALPDADARRDPTVIVDYAHTPDAVDKLLRATRPMAHGRLITVFGCGGDRDRAKRPLMAEAVARTSDRVVATSDNPRTEDPASILRDVEAGLAGLTRVEPGQLPSSDRSYCVVEDRRQAIRVALGAAGAGDTVLLAGKGHEDYQIVGREKLPFDDRDEARRALAERRRAGGFE